MGNTTIIEQELRDAVAAAEDRLRQNPQSAAAAENLKWAQAELDAFNSGKQSQRSAKRD